ncbi:MAG: lipid IV(A) 3-deoxy-D-manno-octulosonic acid transferase [Halioglobus sp.]
MRYLYSAALYILLPFILLRMIIRSRQAPAYRQRLAERFGIFAEDSARQGRPVIWVHAVSVGETLAAAPLIEDLIKRYPGYRVVVTTTTPTGSERVQALFGDRVFHVYAPWDLPGAVNRFVTRLQPRLLLIMETELWPNMLHHANRQGCSIVLANARMSARSAKGYARFSGLVKEMLEKLDVVACQSSDDGERLLSLGLPESALHVTGSIKFDLDLDAQSRDLANTLARDWNTSARKILVAASTHPGEDEQILTAFTRLRKSCDNCLLLIVPRHPERFGEVYQQCERAGYQVVRRSAGHAPGPGDDIVIGDTMGELLLLLSLADVAIIGGSLVPHGGHNVLEASAWGVPVVTGPHMFNFAEISDLMVAANAMVQLNNPADLAATLTELFGDEALRQQMGLAGQKVVAANRGAKKRLLALVDESMAGDGATSS